MQDPIQRIRAGQALLVFDLGGTKLRAALLGAGGELAADLLRPTNPTREGVLASLEEAATTLLRGPGSGFEILGTGVGTAGVVDPRGGTIHYAPNLPLNDFALGEHLARFCPAPVVALNDGRAAALGEAWRGGLPKERSDHLLCLFFGTGIGIGMIGRGRLLRGFHDAAGEIGHTIFKPDGPLCGCGKRGCFEAFCGGRHMALRAEAEVGPAPAGGWTVGRILEAALRGDAGARRIQDEALEAFQVLTANCITLCNPGVVVMGGGVLSGWPELPERIQDSFGRLLLDPARSDTPVLRSRLGSRAILLGAAVAVLQGLEAV